MRPLACLLLAALPACAHDTRTAVEHEREADRHRAVALQAEAVARVEENTRPPATAVEQQMTPTTPFAGVEAGRAAVEIQSARDHERAAKRIREAAELTCRRVPAASRSTCPVTRLGALRVERNGHGVVLTPQKPLAAESLRAEIDCALAEAQVDRPVDADRCPLLVRGARARVVDSPRGLRVEIDTDDDLEAAEVERRANALAAPPATDEQP